MDKREQIQEEAKRAIIANKFVGVLLASPRLGKCRIILNALNTRTKQIKVLITAPKKDIFNSWKEEIKKVGLVDNIQISYSWIHSIYKLEEFYDLVIVDECHECKVKVLKHLREWQKRGMRILPITGTLEQSDEFNLKNFLGLNVIFRYSFEQAIQDGIISDYRITCIGCELDSTTKDVEAGNKEKSFYQTEQQAYTYWDDRYKEDVRLQRNKNRKFLIGKRMEIIYNSKNKIQKTSELLEQFDRCLIFTGRQSIADRIGEASFHSKGDKNNLKRFQNEEINKLATVEMVSMGVTIPNLKKIIFNQLKSVESRAIQQALRACNIDQDKRIAEIYILYIKNSQDEIWTKSALKGFKKEKIKFI
jgi:superfamily II DNA or RNA helicase